MAPLARAETGKYRVLRGGEKLQLAFTRGSCRTTDAAINSGAADASKEDAEVIGIFGEKRADHDVAARQTLCIHGCSVNNAARRALPENEHQINA